MNMKILAVGVTGLGLAGPVQAVPVIYDFTGTGTVSTYLGIGQAMNHVSHAFIGTMTIDVNPAGPDGIVFGTDAYGYDWVTSDFVIDWNSTSFAPAPESGQTPDLYAAITNSSTKDVLYNQEYYSGQSLYTYASLTRSTTDTAWLSDFSFPETVGLAPGISAINEILFGRYSTASSDYTGFYGSMDLTSLTARPTPSVPEPGTLALFGLGTLGMGFLRRRRT